MLVYIIMFVIGVPKTFCGQYFHDLIFKHLKSHNYSIGDNDTFYQKNSYYNVTSSLFPIVYKKNQLKI